MTAADELTRQSCGAIDKGYTRRNRHNQDHRTERVMVSLYHVHQRSKGLQDCENRWPPNWYE